MKHFSIVVLGCTLLTGVLSQPVLSQHPQSYPRDYVPEYNTIPEYTPRNYDYYPPRHFDLNRTYYDYQHQYDANQSVLYNRALRAYQVRNYSQAVVLLKQALEYYPSDDSLKAKYGYCLLKLHRYQESLKVFEEIAQGSKVKKFVAYANQVMPEIKKALTEIQVRKAKKLEEEKERKLLEAQTQPSSSVAAPELPDSSPQPSGSPAPMGAGEPQPSPSGSPTPTPSASPSN